MVSIAITERNGNQMQYEFRGFETDGALRVAGIGEHSGLKTALIERVAATRKQQVQLPLLPPGCGRPTSGLGGT